MTPVPGWHPLIVHFPLALVVSAAALLFSARLVPEPRLAATLATVGTWNLCLGAAAFVPALGSGLAAVLDLHLAAQARHAVTVHVKWAIAAGLGLLLLAVWRGAGNTQDSRPSPLFLGLLIATTGALIVTGYRGGLNVYLYRIGVAP
jgi:uncharacterized membrane protein